MDKELTTKGHEAKHGILVCFSVTSVTLSESDSSKSDLTDH